jgi:hypothetical protein
MSEVPNSGSLSSKLPGYASVEEPGYVSVEEEEEFLVGLVSCSDSLSEELETEDSSSEEEDDLVNLDGSPMYRLDFGSSSHALRVA